MSIYAKRIRDALTASIDTGKLAGAWLALHPDAAKAKRRKSDAVPPALAAFLGAASAAITAALSAVLGLLWAEGWVLGQLSAEAVSAGSAVDWRGWEPGDATAAEALAGDQLAAFLAAGGLVISGITATRVAELAAVLEAALASGVTASALAAELKAVLGDKAAAEMVAQAELARAQSAAAMGVYQEAGAEGKAWVTAEDDRVCAVCDANEAEGSLELGQSSAPATTRPRPT